MKKETITTVTKAVASAIQEHGNKILKNKLNTEFSKIKNSYKHLGNNITEALKKFLEKGNIDYQEVYSRVKDFDSFYNKSNKYNDPFNEIEDICGVRIICYYASDIDKINKIINNEFNVIEQQDISDRFNVNEFGYRSHHFVVKIKESWTAAPNYRDLENFKAEIQVRTISMHAWAEVEHKLNYKSVKEIPHKFKRKISLLSAKFEEIDEQFDTLRNGIEEYQNEITQKIKETNSFDLEQEFNIDTFSAYLNFLSPNEVFDQFLINQTFDFLFGHYVTFKVIKESLDLTKPFKKEVLEDFSKLDSFEKEEVGYPLFIWFSVDIFKERNLENTDDEYKKLIKKWRGNIFNI